MLKKRYLLALAGALILGCSPYQKRDLVGKWQGVAILEEGENLPVDPSEIGFAFRSNATYAFNSTLNYKEEGTFYLNGRLLYTSDTLNKASSEKAVEIQLLNRDSLFLLMQDNGKERLLKLARVK